MDKRGSKRASDEQERLADAVYRTLVDRLISQDIAPGERMSIDAISRDLDVSQTPVRQALAQLEAEGLLTRIHLAGYRAAPLLTWDEFDQLFQMRLLLEPWAAGAAALHRTPEQAREMQDVDQQLRVMSGHVERVTYGVFARTDARLHQLVVEASGNPFVAQAHTRLHAHVHLFRLHYHASVPRDAIGEHEAMLTAIVEGDEAGATRAARRHLRASRARLYAAFADDSEELLLDTHEHEVHDDSA